MPNVKLVNGIHPNSLTWDKPMTAETESSEIIDDDMDALSAETESSEIIDLDRLCRIRSVSEEWSPGLAVYGD